MNAHQIIKEEIRKVSRNINLGNLQIFLERVFDGINSEITLNHRQIKFMYAQISLYSPPGDLRVGGIRNREMTVKKWKKLLLCPNSVNSFVAAINSLKESSE